MIKVKFFILFISFFLSNTFLFGADYYWIGGSGNWSDASHWSSSSGGISVGSTPTGLDNVFFDINSFSISGEQVIIDDSTCVNSMDWSQSTNSPELILDTNLFINGDVTLQSNMSIHSNNLTFRIQFLSQSVFDPAGALVDCNLSVYLNNNNDILDLNSSLLMSDSSTIFFIKGEFNTNGNNISSGIINLVDIDSTSTKSLELGNSSIELAIGFYAYNIIDANFAFNSGTSNILIGDSSYVNYLNCDDLVFYNVTIDFDSTNNQTIKGNNTYNKLSILKGSRVIIDSSSVQTINDSLIIEGTCHDSIYISSSNVNFPVQINKSVSNDIISECVNFHGVTASNSAITTYFSTDKGNNSNITFNPSSAVNASFNVLGPYCFGDTTFFTNTSSPYSGNPNDMSSIWYFNDGSGYYLPPPLDTVWISYQNDTNAHVFIQNGDFSVTLITTYKNLCVDTAINTVHINNPSIYLYTSSDTSICNGTNVSFEASSGVTGAEFEFFHNGISQNTPSVNDTIFTINTLSTNDSVSVVAYENGCISTNEPSYVFVVNPSPVYSWQSNDLDSSICSLDSVTFTANALDTNYLYQFLINNSGVTSYLSTANYTTNSLNNNDTIQLVVKDTLSCTDTSFMVFNVNPLPTTTLTESSGSNVICYGETITFTASGADLYQFYVNGIPQTSLSSSNIFNINSLSSGDSVSVLGETNNGCIKFANEIYSYTVNPLPNVNMTFNSIDTTICSGENVIFNASGASLYEFFINGISQGSPTSFSTLNTTTLNHSDTVYVIGTFSGCSKSSDSAVFTVNISPTTSLVCDDIDAIICSQTNVNFTASGANQYEFFIDGVSQGSPSSTNTFSTTSITNNQTVSVSGESNTCIVSQGIIFSVLPSPSVGFFSSNPNNAICEGESITFTCANADQYELYVNGISQGAAQSTSVFIPNLPNGTDSLYVVGTAVNGCTDSSQIIVVTVTPLPIVTITSSDIDNIFCDGDNITFTGSGANLYQFILDSIPQGSLSSSNTYTTTGIINGQSIYIIGSTLGCTGISPTITNTVNLNPVVALTSNDINNVFCEDQIVTFSASGANNYEFFAAGTSQGISSPVDTLSSANLNIGSYSLLVSGEQNNCFGTASLQISINQLPGATLISSDIDNIICQGDMVTYTSSGANLYEFFVNGVSISPTSPINSFTTSSLNQGDIVSVITSSSNGCTNSSVYAPITVNVNPATSLSSSSTTMQICLNDTVIFNASGANSYEFFVNNISQGASSSNPSISINNLVNGDVVFVNGTTTGCTTPSSSFSFTVYDNPLVSLINNGDSALCDIESTNLLATGANSYQFLINGVATGAFSSVDTLSTFLSNGDVVSVYGETNGCISLSINPITFTVYNTPIISSICSDSDTIICLNDSVHFSVSGATQYLFELNGNPLQNSNQNTFHLNYLENNDTIQITGFNGHCISNINNYIFTVNTMNLNLDFNPSTLICEGDAVTFNASGGDLFEFFVNGISSSPLSTQSTFSSTILNNLDQVSFSAFLNLTGCTQNHPNVIIMNTLQSPLINALSNTTFCEGDSVILLSNSNYGNQWHIDGSPIANATDTTYSALSSGNYTLEVSKGGNGDIFSIGQNSNGIFGTGNNLNSSSPIHSINITNLSSISSGFDFMIGVDSLGNAYSWGENSSGQLGDGTYSSTNTPSLISGISNVKTIGTCESSCMAILNSGDVYVWGNNSQGQLSTGNNNIINFPFLNTSLTNIDTVAAGKNHFIILKNDSSVWVVGNNDFGQLGLGNTNTFNSAQQIVSLNNIVHIGAGEYHSFAIDSAGILYVWGNNSSGQLGVGDLNNRLSPYASTLNNIIDVQGGANHSLFIDANNKVYASGGNNFGQLGLGNQNTYNSPQEISIQGVQLISVSQNSSLFLRDDFSVYGCGNNLENQISPSSNTIINTPTHILELFGIGNIEASKSSSHFLASNYKSCISPSTPVTVLANPIVNIFSNGDTLSCTSGSSYQWYFNGSIIPGATSSPFIANGSGDYSVMVSFANGCTNLSPNFYHSMSSIYDYNAISSRILIYPNPTKEYLNIKINGNNKLFHTILITDLYGRIVNKVKLEEIQNNTISLKNMERGVYKLIFINQTSQIVKKVIKQ